MNEEAFFIENEKQKIFCIFHEGDKHKPLAIFVHGFSGHHMGMHNCFFVHAARELVKKGYNVLRFDFRGSGNSEGSFLKQNMSSMISDLEAIIRYAKKNLKFNGNIVLIGHSRGFFVSLFVANEFKEVKALVSLAGRVSSTKEWWSAVRLRELYTRGKLDWFGVDFPFTKEYVEDEMKYEPEREIEKLEMPVLLIYGKADDVVPACEGIRFKELAKKCAVELHIVPEVNHVFTGEKSKQKAITLILRFLEKVF